MRKALARLLRDEAGSVVTEYGLIAALISLVIISSLTLIAGELMEIFGDVRTGLAAR